MKKSNAIFGVSTSDVVNQIKNDSNNENKMAIVDSPKQKVKALVRKSKVFGHNTKKK